MVCFTDVLRQGYFLFPFGGLQAVRLVAELCLEYKVYDLQLWNGLLQKLLGFSMVSLRPRQRRVQAFTQQPLC